MSGGVERAQYQLARGLVALARWTPEPLLRVSIRCAGRVFWALSKRRRRTTRANLAIAFPEWSSEKRRHVAKQCFDNAADVMVDSVLIGVGRWGPKEILERIDAGELEKYREWVKDWDAGVIRISGHLGNWELLAQFGAVVGFPAVIVARRGKNQLIDDRLVIPSRTRLGNGVIVKRNAVRAMAEILKDSGAVSILVDQKTRERYGAKVSFFGKETWALKTPAILQMRFGARAIPTCMLRTGNGRYRFVVREPIDWVDDGRDREAQARDLTQRHQAAIESMIRESPEQWFWMHDRWRLKL